MLDYQRPAADPPLARRIGHAAALAVINGLGGRTIYVPHARTLRRRARSHPIVAAAGMDAALALAAAASLTEIYVPKARPWRCQYLHDQGMTAAEIADCTGIPRREVSRCIRRRTEGGSGFEAVDRLREAARIVDRAASPDPMSDRPLAEIARRITRARQAAAPHRA